MSGPVLFLGQSVFSFLYSKTASSDQTLNVHQPGAEAGTRRLTENDRLLPCPSPAISLKTLTGNLLRSKRETAARIRDNRRVGL